MRRRWDEGNIPAPSLAEQQASFKGPSRRLSRHSTPESETSLQLRFWRKRGTQRNVPGFHPFLWLYTKYWLGFLRVGKLTTERSQKSAGQQRRPDGAHFFLSHNQGLLASLEPERDSPLTLSSTKVGNNHHFRDVTLPRHPAPPPSTYIHASQCCPIEFSVRMEMSFTCLFNAVATDDVARGVLEMWRVELSNQICSFLSFKLIYISIASWDQLLVSGPKYLKQSTVRVRNLSGWSLRWFLPAVSRHPRLLSFPLSASTCGSIFDFHFLTWPSFTNGPLAKNQSQAEK